MNSLFGEKMKRCRGEEGCAERMREETRSFEAASWDGRRRTARTEMTATEVS